MGETDVVGRDQTVRCPSYGLPGMTQATGDQRVPRHGPDVAAECRHEVSILLARARDVAEMRFVVVACPRIERVRAFLVGGDRGKAEA